MPHDLQKFHTHKKRSAFCVLRFAQGPTRWRAISAGRYRTSNTPTMKTRTPFSSGTKTVLFLPPPAFNTPKDCFTKTGSGKLILPRQARGKLRGNSTKRDRFSLQEQARRVRGAVPRQHLDGLARQPHPRRDWRWCEMLYSRF